VTSSVICPIGILLLLGCTSRSVGGWAVPRMPKKRSAFKKFFHNFMDNIKLKDQNIYGKKTVMFTLINQVVRMVLEWKWFGILTSRLRTMLQEIHKILLIWKFF